MHDWLGPALFAAGVALIGYGWVKRGKRRRVVYPAGSIRPEYVGMSELVRPLLLLALGFFAAETTFHYFVLGGNGLITPVDFGGILFLFASFAVYVLLAVRPPLVAEAGD